MSIRRGAEAIVEALEVRDTELVVGYIGHTTHEIADALGGSGIATINPATELGGAHLLNAYNYLKGRPAATGIWHTVGSLLLHPALAEARASRIPVVHIGLNAESRLRDRDGAVQQVPVEAFVPLSRFARRVERVDKLGESVHQAFEAASGLPMGPAYLDVPFDLTVDRGEIVVPSPGGGAGVGASAAPAEVREAARALVGAERPAIIVGGGAMRAGAGALIEEIAELVGAPIVSTSTGQGTVSEDHPLVMGTAGMAGWRSANEVLGDSDLVLIVGSRLSDWGIAQGYTAKLPARIVQVDVDPARLGEFYAPELSIVADAGAFTEALIEVLPQTEGFEKTPFEEREWVRSAGERKASWRAWLDERGGDGRFPLSKWRVMKEVGDAIGPDDIVVADIGAHSVPVMQGVRARKPKRLLLSFGEAVLGSAFPMGLGAQLAEPGSKVVVGTGDGAFHYHFNELRLAVEQQLPVIVLVLNDGAYGANEGMMQSWYGKSQWTRFQNPDWAAIARAYGAEGERIGAAEELPGALRRAASSDAPYVIDVPIDPAEGFPENEVSGPAMLIKGREHPADVNGSLAAGEQYLGD